MRGDCTKGILHSHIKCRLDGPTREIVQIAEAEEGRRAGKRTGRHRDGMWCAGRALRVRLSEVWVENNRNSARDVMFRCTQASVKLVDKLSDRSSKGSLQDNKLGGHKKVESRGTQKAEKMLQKVCSRVFSTVR